MVEVVNDRPQTRQRVAFSLSLVPQVGQVLGKDVFDSGVIFILLLSSLLDGDYNISDPGTRIPLHVVRIVLFYPLMVKTSLYFHIPFCRRRCGYCDFNTFAGLNSYIPEYVETICQEAAGVIANSTETIAVHTIYFGGGTPSLLSIEQYERIFKTLSKNVHLENDAEISLEANPETVTRKYLSDLNALGFNRISFGMQSASPDDLRVLDRQHKFDSIVDSIKWSKQAGFLHINLDLIFGIPGQSRESWKNSLGLALGFGIDHFSIYSLIVEEGTRLKRWIDKGLLSNPDDDLGALMYEDTMDILEKAGYLQYEISNWSRGEGSQCRHNLQYWRYLPYLGFGAGAHGFLGNIRTENVDTVPQYIQSLKDNRHGDFPSSPAACSTITLSQWDKIQENIMMSLRLTAEGINLGDFHERYGIPLQTLFDEQVRRLVAWGLLEYAGNGKHLRLSRRGRLLGNQVFAEFIGNDVPEGYEYLNH